MMLKTKPAWLETNKYAINMQIQTITVSNLLDNTEIKHNLPPKLPKYPLKMRVKTTN